MPTILSVQSWVACGTVGNNAALFPLQRLGCETWSLNTVQFSNHTGYGSWRGGAVPAQEIASLFEGIAALGVLPRCDAVLSGYLGEPATGPVLLDIARRVKAANPTALFCCDPVMGDFGVGWYVPEGVRTFYRDEALAVADIATPNRFELEFLTGAPIGSLAEAAAAAEALRRRGPRIVLVTSLDAAPGRLAALAIGDAGAWTVETPLLDIEATGCGDAVAALFLAWLLRGKPLPEALATTVASVYGLVEATVRAGGGELALIAAQDEIVSPSRSFPPRLL
jgi:pyridoxine kinase